MSSLQREPQVDPSSAAAELVQHRDPAWVDAFLAAVERQRAGRELARILTVWQLSKTAAGRAFGVSRQAIDKWLDGGVPAERVGVVADVSAATDLLVRHLTRDRIPAVVRRPAEGLGGHSLLDLLDRGETADVLAACRQMFSFGDAHA